MTIVLDTNCLTQILPREAEYRWLYDSILRGEIALAVTTEILDEYAEVLDVFFGSTVLGEYVTKTIIELPKTRKTIVFFNFYLIFDDPDDNKFVDCAVSAAADFIITEDRHFRVLKKIPFPKVTCLTLPQFKKLLVV